ncbi:hypothetical protein [Parendozoicomonas sp. Alg238-R29]|uniref:hypothetical protein n=1 Tax=Parendozoicomonas sp. Alg238-R29 TaxID=2993446 RepID=UPI00248F313D|nr:hypothetical protein [Parendozoicomonas sp. Alg238-R29]
MAQPTFIVNRAQIGSVTTFCGGLIGFMVFQEPYTLQTLLASLLILAGVMVYSRMKMHAAHSHHNQTKAAVQPVSLAAISPTK